MLSKGLKIGSMLFGVAFMVALSGCVHDKSDAGTVGYTSEYDQTGGPGYVNYNSDGDYTNQPPVFVPSGDMPTDAQPGECYAQVYMPPEFETVTDRVCVREASESIEVVPAEYEWVEEQVLVKEASTELVEVPAQFEDEDEEVQTHPGLTTWVKAKQAKCVADGPGHQPKDIFCLVNEPPTMTTVQKQRMVKGPQVEEVDVPAQYQTIRKQRLVHPATTRTVTVPAQYEDINKTVMVAPGRMEWQRVNCDSIALEPVNTEVRPAADWDR